MADSDSLASFLSGHMQDNELEVCFYSLYYHPLLSFHQAVPSEWGLDMDTVSQFSQGPLATPGQGRKSVGDKQPRSKLARAFASLVDNQL